jgi:hypothetical protein
MLKRVGMSLLFLAVIMAAPQLTLADDRCEPRCVTPTCATSACNGDPNCTCINGYDIRAVVNPNTFEFPYNDGTCTGDYCFKYTVTPAPTVVPVGGSICGMKTLEMLIPVCTSDVADNTIAILQSSPSTSIYAAGVGGPVSSFAKYVFQDYLVGFNTAAAQTNGSFFIAANTSESAKTSAAVKLNTSSSVLMGSTIPGPACMQPKLGGQTFKETILNPDDPINSCVHMEFYPSGKMKSARPCNGEGTIPVQDVATITFNGSPLSIIPEGPVKAGLHSCYYYFSGGRYIGPIRSPAGSTCP